MSWSSMSLVQVREEKGLPVVDLLHLVAQIVPYHMTHNAEPEAVDLLLEVRGRQRGIHAGG